MWNGSDVLALAAIAAGTAGSVALYSLLAEASSPDERQIVVEVRQPVQVMTLPFHAPGAWDAPVRHAPHVVIETDVQRGIDRRILADARHIRIERAQKQLEIEKRRHPRPDRKKRKRRPHDLP